MPTFDMDIDPSDYVYECSRYEIRQLIDELEDSGYIKKNSRIGDDEVKPPTDATDFTEMLYKIMESKHQLSAEDEQALQNIFNKLV